MIDLTIEPSHFEYLSIQRGEVSDHRHDFKKWKKAYELSLLSIFESMRPILPESCRSILDIGSGLGGIDILLSRHYSGCRVHLVDGVDDAPVVQKHRQTFNNRRVALDYLRKNGVENCDLFAPTDTLVGRYDLVVSFAAYCFHIEPAVYLDKLRELTDIGSTVVFDVRTEKREWVAELIKAFGKPVVIDRGKKHVRLAWTIR